MLEGKSDIGGYVVSHPWHEGDPPALNACLGELPAPATHYYLHDLAILPERRGGGAGAAAVATLLDHAAAGGFDRVRLVAVGGSGRYWARHGFTALAPAGKTASYGADAQVMTRPVAGGGSGVALAPSFRGDAERRARNP